MKGIYKDVIGVRARKTMEGAFVLGLFEIID